jgi:hypothetical protein
MPQETPVLTRKKIHGVEVLGVHDQGSTFDITLKGTADGDDAPREVKVTSGHDRLVLTLAIAKMMKCQLASVTTEEVAPGKTEIKCVFS